MNMEKIILDLVREVASMKSQLVALKESLAQIYRIGGGVILVWTGAIATQIIISIRNGKGKR